MTDDHGPVCGICCNIWELCKCEEPYSIDEIKVIHARFMDSVVKRLKESISLRSKHEALRSKRQLMKKKLEWVCKFYCDKYDGNKHQEMDWPSVAYEMVSEVRGAIALLHDEDN